MEYVIEMLNIRKEFPGVVANDNITLQVKPGEIHAILGENGAGKSTLMSILFGLYHADRGVIKIRGKEVKISSPNDANELGIGMVHQHFQLVENFTVTENIILGKEGSFVLDRKSAAKKIKALSDRYSLKIDPNMIIENITVGMQQRVEILKMLYRNAEILIFDEPTAVLTPQEVHELLQIMKDLRAEGKSIILITHKLDEIKEVADRCTIIRRGKLIDVVDVDKVSQQKMASMMVGRPVNFKTLKKPVTPGKVVLNLEHLNVKNTKKILAVKDFSLNVRKGEIVGLAGVDGNGQTELVEAITGLVPIESGKVLLDGKDITHEKIRKRNEDGISYIPADRQKRGIVLQLSVAENLIIREFYREPFSKHGILQFDAIEKYSEDLMKKFDVRSGEGVQTPAGKLSGGNQQKAIVGREISYNTDLLIAVQPTRGLDVGAIEFIHNQLEEQREKGKAIFLISFELDEIFNLSDRIAVINEGKLIDVVDTKSATTDQVGLMMAGIKVGEDK